MKILFQTILKPAFFALPLLLLSAAAATAQGPRIQTNNLDYLTAKASETVDINIDEHLIQIAAKVLSNPEDKDIKAAVSGLKGIYVKVFSFDHESEYTTADVESIRSQLRTPGWARIVNINSRKDGSVEVYLMTVNDQISGLAVLAANPKDLTVVNIIGPVDLNKLSKLEGQFGVPVLDLDQTEKTKKN
jgi:Domain of unknown function (DUF4252)